MKTSIVAVIAAGIFLAAAYLGLGSAWKPPGPPQMIVLTGPSSATVSPSGDLPPALPSPSAGSPQVLAVGRQVQQGSLKDLATSRGATASGSGTIAAGPAATPSNQAFDASINATVVLPGSGSGATAPPGANPGPTPVPGSTKVSSPPTHKPRPRPTPTSQPVPAPTPTPTPTPVSGTVTPVTPTVTPSSAVSPPPAP